jgi:hypothetical protein
MSSVFRIISRDDVREPLETAATLAVSDADVGARGVTLSERGWEDGLGEYSGAYLELAGGEQIFLQRLDHMPERVLVFAPLFGDAGNAISALVRALGLAAEQVEWQIAVDDWQRLQGRSSSIRLVPARMRCCSR